MKAVIQSVWPVALCGLLLGCEGPPPASEPVLRSVRTMVIDAPTGDRSRTFSGGSESAQASRLSFKVGGTITSLPVTVGMTLDAGDRVAELDPSPYELQAEQAQAALVQAEASQRNAEANYERVKGLYENSNASLNDLDAARAAAESAAAAVRAGEKALELARLNASYTVLRAADDCTVADVTAEVNENVSAGTPVAVVNCGGGIHVSVDVPESVIGSIRDGMRASVSFSAIPDRFYEGRVIETGVSSSSSASTFPVTIAIDSPDDSLRAGLAAEVTFALNRSGASVYIVPLAAVVNDPSGSYVFVTMPTDTDGQTVIARKPVELGNLTEQGMEIASGLEPGDRVVTAGVSAIREGQTVLTGPGQ